VFGSTGSVGRNTIDLILRRFEEFEVIALSGGRNVKLLAKQAIALRAKVAVVAHRDLLTDLQDALAGSGVHARAGRDAILEAATNDVDWAMSAVVGFAGLEISLEIAKHSKVLALANKESLVCGGALVQSTCSKTGCLLLPVDSEHSAIFQCIGGMDKSVERIILTASGGPFLNSSMTTMEKATPEQAMAHPNWDMGQRISIDSASMFNKAMEVIETHVLFDVLPDQIEVIVHPQSIIHSMVGFDDGAIMAHLGPPDMRAPIGFALNWPERTALPVERLDFSTLGALTFKSPQTDRYPSLLLAQQTMELGGLAGAAFNAAKEAALDMFLAREIGFLDMARLVQVVLGQIDADRNVDVTLEAVLAMDATARKLSSQAAREGL
jgi:1-deoxy-D-xylulose-5-phosphate reductoisomerase